MKVQLVVHDSALPPPLYSLAFSSTREKWCARYEEKRRAATFRLKLPQSVPQLPELWYCLIGTVAACWHGRSLAFRLARPRDGAGTRRLFYFYIVAIACAMCTQPRR